MEAENKPVPVHVIDQTGQPYGSVRRCCNMCGVMAMPGMTYVESEAEWYEREDNCAKVKS